jgi:phosphopantothenoylcysteine synthetase/decarboxylase
LRHWEVYVSDQRETNHRTGSAQEQRDKLLRKIVLAVTGSVGAADTIPRFIGILRSIFAENVVVVLSESAKNFVSPYVASLFSGQPAVADFFAAEPFAVPHIQCCEGADVLLVMPATANIIGKVANGIADEIVSATVLAATCPVVFVPSMNGVMWSKKAMQRNAARLREDGYHIIEPTWGTEIANFERTFGAMPPFTRILREMASLLGIRLPDTGEAEPLSKSQIA